jgi:glyoxylase-like metal-dependent hydrolase (beta-lactamase superfamily II)
MPSVDPLAAVNAGGPALPGLSVLQRGWLSSNNVVLHGAPGEGATLVDSGHSVHAAQTLALLSHTLKDEGLARVVNTHLHSDHCGGNATLQREFGVPVTVPAASFATVQPWDEDALSYRYTGQRCDRFSAQAALAPGDALRVGDATWQALAAPGHDPQSLMLFDGQGGVLISADALWENGFGVVFPELEGIAAFDDVEAVLNLIEQLPVRVVIPGHGAPFTDVASALQRARTRLAGQRADPARHARHGARVMIKYHLMEVRSLAWPDLLRWTSSAPLFGRVWQRFAQSEAASPGAWCERLVGELIGSGALSRVDDVIHDR